MRQQVAQSGVVDFVYSMLNFAIVPHPSFCTSLFLSPFWRPHSVCGTEVILLLDICDWSVANGLVCGPHVEWRRCPPFVQIFPFLVLDMSCKSSNEWQGMRWVILLLFLPCPLLILSFGGSLYSVPWPCLVSQTPPSILLWVWCSSTPCSSIPSTWLHSMLKISSTFEPPMSPNAHVAAFRWRDLKDLGFVYHPHVFIMYYRIVSFFNTMHLQLEARIEGFQKESEGIVQWPDAKQPVSWFDLVTFFQMNLAHLGMNHV